MESESRKPIGGYFRKPRIYWEGLKEGQPLILRPRKVIGSYGRNFRRLDEPSPPWAIQAAEAWRRQREREGQPIFIKPRKAIGGYFRKPKAA